MPSPCSLPCMGYNPKCGHWQAGSVPLRSPSTSAFSFHGLAGIIQAHRPIHEDQAQDLEGTCCTDSHSSIGYHLVTSSCLVHLSSSFQALQITTPCSRCWPCPLSDQRCRLHSCRKVVGQKDSFPYSTPTYGRIPIFLVCNYHPHMPDGYPRIPYPKCRPCNEGSINV